MPFKFFQSRDDDDRPVPNDCDLEARQQRSIEDAGYTNPTRSNNSWTATGSDSSPKKVPIDVYYGDSTAAGEAE